MTNKPDSLWQPIEKAPRKRGTAIIVAVPGRRGWSIGEALYLAATLGGDPDWYWAERGSKFAEDWAKPIRDMGPAPLFFIPMPRYRPCPHSLSLLDYEPPRVAEGFLSEQSRAGEFEEPFGASGFLRA